VNTGPQDRDRFGCYTILKDNAAQPVRLGQGAWGDVYKAFNGDLRCYAALRIIPSDAFSTGESREQFAEEVRAAARVRHPRLASVFPLEVIEDALVYATEFCEGETVASLIARDGSLPVAAALAVISQIAAALDAAVAEGVFHRNITAGNIMLAPYEDEEIAAKLVDLGLPRGEPARHCDLRSPQEAAGGALDAPSGVFSLGALFYCMTAGVEKFELLRATLFENQSARADDAPDGAPAEILSRTLCHDPAARIQTFAELRDLAASREPARPNILPSPRILESVAEAPPSAPQAPSAVAVAALLSIPSRMLGAAQPGALLRLKPIGGGGGLPVIACARDHIRIGRLAAAAELAVRFLPRNPSNDAKTKLLSKVHISARCENGQLLLFDGDGLRPSANGSTFDGRNLSVETPLVLENPGELLLADEYSIKVIPLPSKQDAPAIANFADWTGPKIETKPPVAGAVLFAPEISSENGVAVWLFSVASFGIGDGASLDFALPAGACETGALRHYCGCFWLEQRQGDSLRLDDIALSPAEIAPLATGQIIGLAAARYAVQVG